MREEEKKVRVLKECMDGDICKYMKFNNVKHTGYFKNTDLIVEASYDESIAENGSIVNFEKISGRLTHYFYGVNFFQCTKANKMMP